MEITVAELVPTVMVAVLGTVVVMMAKGWSPSPSPAAYARTDVPAIDPQVRARMEQLSPVELADHARKIEREVLVQLGDVAKIKPRIVIIGDAGTGKSSIINAAFGHKIARTGGARHTTKGIVEYPATRECPVHLYDSEGFAGEAGPTKAKENLRSLVAKCREASCKYPPDSPECLGERVHAVWWVDGGRLPEQLFATVRDIFGESVPFFVIFNKCDVDAKIVDERLEAARKMYVDVKVFPVVAVPDAPFKKQCEQCGSGNLTMKVSEGIYVCEEPQCPSSGSPFFYRHPYGIDGLLRSTHEVLPDLLKDAFLLAQADWLEGKFRSAHIWIWGHTTAAGAIGATPIPFSDFPLLVANQVAMGRLLAYHYGVTVAESALKELVATMLSGSVIAGLGLLFGSSLKLMPGVGTGLGVAMDALIASSFTFGLGVLMNNLFYLAKKNGINELDSTTMNKLVSSSEQKVIFRQAFTRFSKGDRQEMGPAFN